MDKDLWLAWHSSQRSQNLSADLGVPIAEKVIENNLLCRHLFSSLWTLYILIRKRPRNVYLQYSFLLLIVIAAYKRLVPYSVRIICDCHTKALRRSVNGGLGCFFAWLKKRSFSSADVCIISNEEMEPDLDGLSSNFCIVPDKLPNINVSGAGTVKGLYCVFVGSYAVDEPLTDVIAAAERLNGQVTVYCTGKIPKGQDQLKEKMYKNVVFTDYLSRHEYERLMANASCILALTSEDGCLQCACYEALAVEVPLVVSDTTALRKYCQSAVIYVRHSARDIANGIRESIENRVILQTDMRSLKEERVQEYQKSLSRLITMVDACS